MVVKARQSLIKLKMCHIVVKTEQYFIEKKLYHNKAGQYSNEKKEYHRVDWLTKLERVERDRNSISTMKSQEDYR